MFEKESEIDRQTHVCAVNWQARTNC